MAQVRGETPIQPDLAAAAKALGIDPSALAGGATSGFNPSNEATWKVYRGQVDTPRYSDARGGITSGGMRDSLSSFDSAYADVFNWARQGDARFGSIVQSMFDANLIPEEWDIKQVQSVWGWAVQQSALLYGARTAKMTPEEIIALAAQQGNAARGGAGRSRSGSGRGRGGSGGGRQTQTQTSTSVDLSNADTAKAIINKALEGALGRAATDAEVSQFHAALNAKEQANPTKTTTTVTASGSNVSSSSTTSGGFDGTSKMQFAEDTAKNNTEYAEYQAATTYFDAMMGALAAPTGG